MNVLPNSQLKTETLQQQGNPGAFAPSQALGQKDFLMLLTTQMMNQDPTKPMDPTAFVSDLTQMSQLEATAQLNQSVMAMTAGFQNLQVMQASSMIGKNVVAKGEVFSHQAGEASTIRLNTTEPLKDARLVITNSAGVVKELSYPSLARGDTTVSWDGKNTAGLDVSSGEYRLVAFGYSAEGDIKSVSSYVGTSVRSVSVEPDGSMMLTLATGERVKMNAVREIS
ncbi:flagellar hook capping FlgD N-terminal domain-containing protein [Thiomicrospira sp. R3]|uniref:flagellar hook assembly protein FlgD n=1 Tax=Thiomicrospira sp. R3 TaxID=3035472 RepID=UPI00259B9EE4|nr:flagellar hook capping FlgD N-terminal domain-containing protein [Thiomicrospira sp. R3]WFE67888.1 flagellar hook capping FlgD N-terminal domain-containing protein [Thiomicrospira sp. R3]